MAVAGIVLTHQDAHSIVAFPGCEGWGCDTTTGGRGGTLYLITNTNDSGTGSLRECVEASGARNCVILVGGTVTLGSRLTVSSGNIGIYGQLAGTTGFSLTGHEFRINASNVIVRFIKSRPNVTSASDLDAFSVGGSCSGGGANDISNIILDHVSAARANDEGISLSQCVYNATVQWSYSGENLSGAKIPAGVPHAMGLMVAHGSTRISVHHNYMPSNTERNPMCQGGSSIGRNANGEAHSYCDFVNNIVFNWGSWGAWGTTEYDSIHLNFIGNAYRAGDTSVANGTELRPCIRFWTTSATNAANSRWYHDDNRYYTDIEGTPTATACSTSDGSIVVGSSYPAALQSRHDFPAVTTYAVATAETNVLTLAGDIIPAQDAMDARLEADYAEAAACSCDIYATPAAAPALPTLTSAQNITDTDNDGMDDTWETTNNLQVGTADHNGDADGDGYTNLEEYLNSVVTGAFPGTLGSGPGAEVADAGGGGGEGPNVPTFGGIWTGETGVGGSNTVTISNVAVGADANRYLAVCCAIRDAAVTVSSMSFGAQTPVEHDNRLHPDNTVYISMGGLVAPNNATNDVVVTLSASDNAACYAAYFYGVEQATPRNAVAENDSGAGSTTSHSINATTVTDDLVLDCIAVDSQQAASLAPTEAGQSSRAVQQSTNGSGDITVGASTRAHVASPTTMGWSWTNFNDAAQIAVSLDAAGASTEVLTQVRYEWQRTDQTQANATAALALGEDQNLTLPSGGAAVLRIKVSCTSAACSTFLPQLYFDKNGAASYAAVGADCTAADVCLNIARAPKLVSGEQTTEALTAITDYQPGYVIPTNALAQNYTLALNDDTEFVFVIEFAQNLTQGDDYDFRLYRGTNAFDAYTITPRATIGPPVVGLR